MKRQIAASKDVRLKLMKLFGVTERTVFNALSLESADNVLHKKVRKAALEMGGVEMVTFPASELETFHDTGEGMRQYLPNGAVLEFNFSDGACDVWFKGVKRERVERVAVQDIRGIQERASSLN